MAFITTQKGEIIIVDNNLFPELNKHIWNITPSGYASRGISGGGTIYLHRYLTNCPKGMTVDHLNENRLDNRLDNLEVITKKELHERKKKREYEHHVKHLREQWEARQKEENKNN